MTFDEWLKTTNITTDDTLLYNWGITVWQAAMAAVPTQRQPLSDEQRRAIYKNAREAVEATWPHGRNFVDFVVDGVEAAHGITAARAAQKGENE